MSSPEKPPNFDRENMMSQSDKRANPDRELRQRRIPFRTTRQNESGGAQFQGSFAAGTRQDQWTVEKEPGTWNAIYDYVTYGWNKKTIWKSAFIEFIGTAFQVYIMAMMSITVVNFQSPYLPAYAGVVGAIYISLFIYGTAAASGGHLNPMITFSTLLAGLTEFPRAVLYILAQTAGAVLAGGMIRGCLGKATTEKYQGGGCFLNNSTTDSFSIGQAFLLETIFSLICIFLAFGIGLDPRQAQLFGPSIGPAMVGVTVGVLIFASAGLGFPGYSGPSFNPGRCLAYSVARHDFENQWIFWIGPMAAAFVHGAIYHTVPPFTLVRICDVGVE
ncbi:aquaporin-like protein [Lipomyces tetrasporus]|uniref:Aquaporin-like protein n=1 Tax=Lipomyces tetrasporus TaxID=54092 RepID=A0AAD7QW94_9ASCO|nr:aquaporin-like protein [Lipomyces tetrasporus]KAJ8102406.1 aquaporin-like protein [Lipomyces tetrasporus]